MIDAAALLETCRQRGLTIVTAESCTGGLIAGRLTDIAGSSDVVFGGFVVYANRAKTELLGVPAPLIETHGAVSAEVAAAMVEGALARTPADLAVAVTGIAGPGGGSAEKPVGLVHFAAARRDGAVMAEHRVFPGDRAAIRAATVDLALAMLERLAQEPWVA